MCYNKVYYLLDLCQQGKSATSLTSKAVGGEVVRVRRETAVLAVTSGSVYIGLKKNKKLVNGHRRKKKKKKTATNANNRNAIMSSSSLAS